MVDHMVRAFGTSVEFARTTQYPSLTTDHLENDLKTHQNSYGFVLKSNTTWRAYERERNSIMRRLAYRAGIIKMEPEAYDLLWRRLGMLVFRLLEPAYLSLLLRDTPSPDTVSPDTKTLKYVCRDAGQTIRNTPSQPFCLKGKWYHLAVPSQVEDAAKELGIVWKVYGNEWYVSAESNETKKSALKRELNSLIGIQHFYREADGNDVLMDEYFPIEHVIKKRKILYTEEDMDGWWVLKDDASESDWKPDEESNCEDDESLSDFFVTMDE
jgi:hypothetical protein